MRAYEAGNYPRAQALLTQALREIPADSQQDSAHATLALAAYFNRDYPHVIDAAGKLEGVPPALALVVASPWFEPGSPSQAFAYWKRSRPITRTNRRYARSPRGSRHFDAAASANRRGALSSVQPCG